MKKLIFVLACFCFVLPSAFASGDVREVSSKAWLRHITVMNHLRAQIFSLVAKDGIADADKADLEKLLKKFDRKKRAWDNYLVRVSQGLRHSHKGKHLKCKGKHSKKALRNCRCTKHTKCVKGCSSSPKCICKQHTCKRHNCKGQSCEHGAHQHGEHGHCQHEHGAHQHGEHSHCQHEHGAHQHGEHSHCQHGH